ncbi:hypothetical protein FRC07_000719 [Ceratobasidium sp. 392]|nr:hypothetical protein FRC07_000719 [Ceratobasidium sp. 392]
MHFKSFVAILAASAAATPIQPRQDPNYVPGLVQALQQSNRSGLANALTQYASTQQGQQVASILSNGNYTLLAPDDQSLQSLNGDNSTLYALLGYHILNGSFLANLVAPARSHSVVPTLLTNNTYVNLGGSPQVQVLEQTADRNGIVVRRTTGNATVTNSTTYQNLIIHPVDAILTPPGDLKAALSSNLVTRAPGGFTQLGSSLQKTGILDSVNDQVSTTVFAPIDDAFVAINSTVAGLSNDQLKSVLQNHVINNNVIYSPQFNSTPNATAASGVSLNFTNENGLKYVSYNQTRARILRSDVVVKNGVVHVIDAVLA